MRGYIGVMSVPRLSCFFALVALVGTGCANTSAAKSKVGAGQYKEFIPIDPLPADMVSFFDDRGVKNTKAWNEIPSGDRTNLLPNQAALTVVEKLDASTNASYLTAGIAAEVGSYRVVLDYIKYLVNEIPEYTAEGRPTGYYRTGVGIRIKANVLTTKADVNLGSLIALGFAAKEGSARGDLSVELIGIDSSEISQLFPMPSQVNETSIQKVLESVAAIKSKLNDKNTRLTPQIVAVKLAEGVTDLEQVKSKVPSLGESRSSYRQWQQQEQQKQQQEQQKQQQEQQPKVTPPK